MEWLNTPCQLPDARVLEVALERQSRLTKPPGALGALEAVAVMLAGLQGREQPCVDKVCISIFAADHGVAEEGVSAFPQAVTAQMVQNFLAGGAAISVLAGELGATLEVVDVGVKTPLFHPQLVSQRAGDGTANSALEAAMSQAQLHLALQAGADALERAHAAGADLFIGGEMGIANTTAATALYCALLDAPIREATGAGTGLDAAGMAHKVTVIRRILNKHRQHFHDPMETLRCIGGFEIAALTGAYLRAAQLGVPVLVDGFIGTAAALVALRYQPAVGEWLLLSHQSAEQGYKFALAAFTHPPLLDLGMRLGEGSGAAVAVPLLRLACALHNNMATFAEAAVAAKL
ncbi:MAG TPA: nicotinate-nucleotide--dimethylbenzimidazole phosphoribosyltransferase [Candidatus Thiothrix moscowensis]|uniref:nicotinate-nucleotide--dimethylbenzimidazole phosphoribosyltransferase n=1 Tax=unclassified Thiothrix TaxID=2636184 RepID=UPI0025FDC251|nr:MULTISPECIES: nicotinate-nucleotide--dimethylbenzimidazole phosphoribosyltransferase [unclassified Thiothrix]HRJ52715.1 nicotinate-nucleotide--dimethylbenzimidazole phosphoribosyltransferase [Candidatus Thiothrix moscowensis]HRJ92801.1 nicotinate-nucleotide--dimethylbenzimidazole phosphoribosyltransferase [Candidatus Thiothrix moscowensis]